MQVKRYESVGEFYQQVESYLLKNEERHCLMLGILNMLSKTQNYNRYPPYLSCVMDNGDVVAVATRTPPHNLILSEMANPNALELIAGDVRQVYSELPGVIGEKTVTKSFAELWQKVSGQSCRLGLHERGYRLEQVQAVNGVSGECRAPSTEERETVIQWWIDFAVEAIDGIAREDAERQVVNRTTGDPELQGLRLWYDNGKPVSLAGYSGWTPSGMRVGPVYTPPEFRGHGYASACTAALSQEMLDRGRKFCFLFTDLSNPTSNHIYQTIGYEPVCDFDEYRFGDRP